MNWNDRKIPIGKRKQSYVKWLMKQRISLKDAKLLCYRRFRAEIEAENRSVIWELREREDA